MELVHRLLAEASVLAVGLGLAWSLAVVAGRAARPSLDRYGLMVAAAFLVVAAAGLGSLSAGGHPGEELHYVYAGLAVVLVPLARTFAGGEARRDAWLNLGAWVVLAAVLYRLFATG